MRHPILAFALACAAGAFTAATTSAVTCYELLDRYDNIIYRDIYPPVDLSDSGAAERQALRSRGERLISMEADRCPAIEFFTGFAGDARLNFEQMSDGTASHAVPALPREASRGVTPPKRGAAAKSAPAKSAAPAARVDKPEATRN